VGQQEPVVRNAIIALGSLHEDYQIRGGKYDPQLIDDPSYREVTTLYGKALRQLNEQLNKPTKTNAKFAIICSILFACFEVLRRNNMGAVVHYQQGMRQLMRQMNLPEADDTAVTSYSNGTYQNRHRQIPQGELDIIMRVFARYDIQACTFSKDHAERVSLEMPQTVPTSLTLEQVRNHLDNLLICVYQLIKSDLRMYRYWNEANVPSQWRARRQEAVSTFSDWLGALEAFLQQSSTPLNAAERRGLLGLQFQIKVALIMLKMCIDCKPETTYDMFVTDFEDIVSRTEKLFQSLALIDARPLDQEHTEFSMELGLVHPLFFVAVKCRDWNLRRRAIAQLRKAGKEGVWEGPIMAVLAQKIMRLEEQGVTRGTLVPERNRFHEIKKNVDYDGRQILFELTKPLDDTYQNWHIHRDAVKF
jgi:Fungal specific transcription factor domain